MLETQNDRYRLELVGCYTPKNQSSRGFEDLGFHDSTPDSDIDTFVDSY